MASTTTVQSDTVTDKATPERKSKHHHPHLFALLFRLFKHMKTAKWLYFFGILFMLGDAGMQTLIPMLFRHVLNAIQVNSAAFMAGPIWSVVGVAVLMTLIFFPCAYLGHAFIRVSMTTLTRNLRISLFEHVQNLSSDFFQKKQVGEISSRLSGDLDVIESAMGLSIGMIWAAAVLSYTLTMMLMINAYLACLFIALMVIVMIMTTIFLPKVRRMNRRVRDATGAATATITEYISINALIKAYGREDLSAAKVTEQAHDVKNRMTYTIWRQNLYTDSMQVLTSFVAPLSLLFIGAWLIQRDNLKIGDLTAFWGFWLMTGGALGFIFNGLTQVVAGLSAADRIYEFFDENPLVKDKPNAKSPENIKGELKLTDVCFNYPTDSKNRVIHHLDLTFKAGEMVALVGPSGSGKSTILQLLLRFYDPSVGKVTLDGIDLKDLKQRELRQNIGFVMQESFFFAGSIRENLLMAKEDATDEELREALQNANALNFVDEMPDGLNTLLGERGARLSGGQKQRLSIARAFLKNPPILLLDEATSALDSLSEKLVQEAMDRLIEGRTTIVVAHRIATIRHADRICVLDKGRIQAMGPHEELLEKNMLYKELCEHQMID